MDKIKNLLQQVSIIQKKYDDLAEYSGENYNVFDVLGVRSNELSHSAIISDLLNAKGQHGQKDIFLQLFINQFQDTFKTQEKKYLFQNFKTLKSTAVTEKFAGKVNYETEQGGRIDIIINDGNYNIIIENKIYAGDQQLQLKRYNEFDSKAPIFYLTLYGTEPCKSSKKNLKNGENYSCISYETDIELWLENCIKEMVNKPIIRETLNQYLFLIKSLTNQSNNNKMSEEIIKIMVDNIGSSFEVYKNFEKLKIKLFQSFLEKLKYKLSVDIIVEVSPNIGAKHSTVSFRKENWGNNIKILLYFDGNNFSNVIIGVHEEKINSEVKAKFQENFKNIHFESKKNYPNWYILYSYGRFDRINSEDFWINLNSESFINSIHDDLKVFCEIIDKTLK